MQFLFFLLGVALILLKITGVIHASWIVVTIPFWLGPIVVAVVLALALSTGLLVGAFKYLTGRI